MKKAISLILALTLTLTLVSGVALAFSDAYGSGVWKEDTDLQEGVTLSDNTYWSYYYEQLRHEYFLTVEPGSAVTPVAVYGASVCDRLTVTDAARQQEAQGRRVVAGINGDYYDTATGYPLGLLISGGEILSGADSNYALGFRSDGSAIIGEPKLSITAEHDGRSLTIASINKPRVEGAGVTLLTCDFQNDRSTAVHTAGLTVVCEILSGAASMGGAMNLRVLYSEIGTQAVVLEEEQVALTISESGYTVDKYFLEQLFPGEELTISFSAADSAWNNVTEAVGAMYLLVENGTALAGLSTSYAPRSAVGIKANGELVLYTVDGRQTEHSMGASLNILAQRMAELGCETAVSLDGGGSTTLAATLPDSDSAGVINSPSDQSERKVSNLLLLLASGEATGIPDHIYLRASSHIVLPGHTVELNAALVDTNYFPMDEEITYECSKGEIIDGVFYAPEDGGPVFITAYAGDYYVETQILVVETPDELHVYWDGAQEDAVTMVPGDSAELSVIAIYNHMKLATIPGDFVYEIDESLGRIDENGIVTTNYTEGSGTVCVSKGDLTVKIPLTLDGRSPFADTAGHWGVGYLCALYHKGILNGVQQDGGLYANPDQGVTRQEFAVFLARFLNLNTDDYAEVVTPFSDMDTVAEWAANAVRAMYALGIVGGIAQPDGTLIFDPGATLSRAQAVTMLGRTEIGEAIAADLSAFTDESEIPDYARAHFETMVALGVINGNNAQLAPNRAMTRAEVCKVLATMP